MSTGQRIGEFLQLFALADGDFNYPFCFAQCNTKEILISSAIVQRVLYLIIDALYV